MSGQAMKLFSKADLHVHSKYSRQPSGWISQKLGFYECYTCPFEIYRLAKQRGMDFVTITDHDSIDGALEIAHLEGVFISEETTTYFPEDGCVIHVIVLDISEKQHRDIQKCRENIVELVGYLHSQNILHFVAHPFFDSDGKLTPEHFEKLLTLFQGFEVKNGGREVYPPDRLERVITSLNPERIWQLADKYGIEPVGEQPWKKFMVGGSDDHSGLFIALAHTVCPQSEKVSDFLNAIRQGKSKAEGHWGTPLTFAHTLYSVTYHYSRERSRQSTHNSSNIFSFLLSLKKKAETSKESSFHSYQGNAQNNTDINQFLEQLSKRLGLLSQIKNTEDLLHANEKIYTSVSHLSNRLLARRIRNLLNQISSFQLSEVLQELAHLANVCLFLSPYFIAYSRQNKERQLIDEISKRFLEKGSSNEGKIAFFTDTLREVNGVTTGLKEMLEYGRKQGKRFTIIGCLEEESQFTEYETYFQSVLSLPLPEYPVLKLHLPPILDVLKYCWEKRFSLFHISTPGPVGLTGLLLSKILHIPAVGTYHTHFPEYVRYLTGDEAMERLTWEYMRWFYGQMKTVYCPSQNTIEHLVKNGFDPGRLKLVPRGVDTKLFHPNKRNSHLWSHLNREVRLLYVGRISKEKDLDVLVDSFRSLNHGKKKVALIFIGDGPYRKELMEKLNGNNVLFTGYLQGDKLAEAYASSDIFVFPSATDTFGRVVLEAQASGLPVVVSDEGGPRENVLPGKTGLIVPKKDAIALKEALEYLINNPQERKAMGNEARRFAESKDIATVFEEFWKVTEYEVANSFAS